MLGQNAHSVLVAVLLPPFEVHHEVDSAFSALPGRVVRPKLPRDGDVAMLAQLELARSVARAAVCRFLSAVDLGEHVAKVGAA